MTKINPIEYNVLLRQDAVEGKTKGGLLKPEDMIEREKFSQTRGIIAAISPMAFAFEDWPADAGKPQVGDMVLFTRHAGTFVNVDEDEYRVVKDREIVAVIDNG